MSRWYRRALDACRLREFYKGALAKVRPDELAAQVVKGLMKKTGVNPDLIEDLILGCAFPEAEQGLNLARMVTFLAELPRTVAGTTVNRFCGSSMQSIHMAAGAIQMNAGEAFICAGVEGMSRVPMTGYNPMPHPELYKNYPQAYMGMGDTAENLVEKYKISREEQDAFAVKSHEKATSARAAGYFKDEIIPIDTGKGIVEEDGCIRPGTDMETLARPGDHRVPADLQGRPDLLREDLLPGPRPRRRPGLQSAVPGVEEERPLGVGS